MVAIALHTRLRAGKEAEYEAVHAVIPAELDAALRSAGVRSWRIWRDGRERMRPVWSRFGAPPPPTCERN